MVHIDKATSGGRTSDKHTKISITQRIKSLINSTAKLYTKLQT